MQIAITPAEVELALARIEPGLSRYLAVMGFTTGHTRWYDNPDFRRQFNAFYRVRRNKETWQPAFYELFGEATVTMHSFKDILLKLHARTGRIEASFASKLFATLHPHAPVIDAEVMRNLGVRLPSSTTPIAERVERIVELHAQMCRCFDAYVSSDAGVSMLQAFQTRFPQAGITPQKVLDLVLWQNRAKKSV